VLGMLEEIVLEDERAEVDPPSRGDSQDLQVDGKG
jgi:hypothetical protein